MGGAWEKARDRYLMPHRESPTIWPNTIRCARESRSLTRAQLAESMSGEYVVLKEETRHTRKGSVYLKDVTTQFTGYPTTAADIKAWEDGTAPVPEGALAPLCEVTHYPQGFFEHADNPAAFDGLIHFSGDGIVACDHPGCIYCADYLCDFPMGDGKTCDANLCEEHAVGLGEQDDEDEYALHFCAAHALIAQGMVGTLPMQPPEGDDDA